MKKKILAGILSVLMSVTMYSPVIAEEMPEPTSGDPDITEIQETEKEDLAPGISEESAEPAVAEEAGETEDTEILPEEPEEEPVITEEPGETEPEIIGAEGTDDPEMLEGEANPEEPEETEEESAEEPEIILNADAFSEAYTVGALEVKVSYEAGTVPEGTEVVVTEGKPEAIEALKAGLGDDIGYAAADISFVYEGEEIEPKDYSDNKVAVVLTYKGEEDLSGVEFETLHIAETLDEEGNVVYGIETLDAVMTDETDTIQVPYEYTWTETVPTYKDVDIYEDVTVEHPVEKEVPVYETREITEQRTTYVTKTRLVKSTRTVKVKVAFRLFDPSTWLGYKYVQQPYLKEETYKEPVTETVVVGTEEVQVGTKTVTEYEYTTEKRYVRTDKVEDGTEEVEHTETRYEDKEVVVGQTAAFETNDFSTFTVTWGNNEGSSVTVHHGYMQSGAFVEFTKADSLNPNNYPESNLRARDYYGEYAYLIYDFKDYKYSATYRTNGETANPANGTAIRPTLIAGGGNNRNGRRWYTQNVNNIYDYNELNSNNEIYVVYTPKVATTGYTPSSDDDPDDPGTDDYVPEVGKVVSAMKADGTYDITLSVLGHEDSSEQIVRARVIVVFDVSGSMSWGMGGQWSGGTSRLQLAKNAVNAMANELLSKTDSQGNKLVELGLVTFSSDATKRQFGGQDFTDNYTTFSNTVNGLNATGGTNWEAALDLANSMEVSSRGKTYIVFVSDGDPTFRTSRDDVSDDEISGNGDNYDYNGGTIRFGTGSGSYTQCFNTALIAAKSIVSHNKTLYSVGLSNDVTRMSNLASQAGGTYFDGSDEDEFAAAMNSIASAISSEVGLTDVEITDGVTEMSQVATDALIGTTGNFVYRKGTSSTVADNPVWEGAPEAELNANNSVVWDLSSAGTLEDGVLYSVTFTVWPKQEAYDLIADLDNGIRKITDANLEAGTKAQLRVLVGGTTYEYDTTTGTWTGGLTDAKLQALIDAGDPTFSMKTNTGLSASYKYGGVPNSTAYTNYTNGNMALDDTSINIKKTWNNYIDAQGAANVTLTITRNGSDYMDITMGTPVEVATETGGKQWVQTPTQELFISLGVLSVTGDTITVRETGYDYTVIEPENFSYRWDLSAEIYHPMVINGVTTVLIEVQDTTGLPESVTGLADNKTITVDGSTYYKFNGNLYVVSTGDNLLEATNDRRSNLIINKVVDETDAPADDLFPFQITITNPNDPKAGDEGYNFWYHAPWFYVSTASNDRNTIVIDGVEVSDNVTPEVSELRTDNTHITNIVTHEADDTYPYPYITYNYDGTPNTVKAVDLEVHSGSETVDEQTVNYQYYSYYTGYYWFDNGATATVKIKDGWYINFNNMGKDTTYTIVEPTADLPDGYTFKEATTTAQNKQNETVTPGTVSGNTVTGTIEKPNTDFMATYKNTFDGYFYVYHSSDNTVERYPMAVDGVKVTEFDIFARTAENTLYGGYYSDYAGKSNGYDSAALTYTLDTTDNIYKSADGGTDKKAYTYQYIKDSSRGAWTSANAYTTTGTAMVPKGGKTYFLKEVPENYLLPYTHYTYYKADKRLGTLWTITAIDDLNYNSTGFIVKTDDLPAIVVESMTIKAENSTATTTLTAEKVFKAKSILAGYLGYADISSYKGSTTVIKQYWVTPDGITVKGTTQRTLTFTNELITGLKKADAPCED